MFKILFLCHGNICRSPAGEIVFRNMVKNAGYEKAFGISSAATSTEELGNPVYPLMRRVLCAHGLDCAGHRAHQVTAAEIGSADLVITMDEENMYMLRRRFGESAKYVPLMSFAGKGNTEVSDPWYTRDFEGCYADIVEGCKGLMNSVTVFDFSNVGNKKDMFAILREGMEWENWYGENLDALHDIVTGLPHKGRLFAIVPPEKENLRTYAEIMENILNNREN